MAAHGMGHQNTGTPIRHSAYVCVGGLCGEQHGQTILCGQKQKNYVSTQMST